MDTLFRERELLNAYEVINGNLSSSKAALRNIRKIYGDAFDDDNDICEKFSKDSLGNGSGDQKQKVQKERNETAFSGYSSLHGMSCSSFPSTSKDSRENDSLQQLNFYDINSSDVSSENDRKNIFHRIIKLDDDDSRTLTECEQAFSDLTEIQTSYLSMDAHEKIVFDDTANYLSIPEEELTPQPTDKVLDGLKDIDEVILNVEEAVVENNRLRENIAMNHYSLTLLELREEKILREALQENVGCHSYIQKLQDELLVMKLNSDQHRRDIQRLMAENSRLKLQVKELKSKSPSKVLKSNLQNTFKPTKLSSIPNKSKDEVDVPLKPGLEALHEPKFQNIVQKCTITSMMAPIQDTRQKLAELKLTLNVSESSNGMNGLNSLCSSTESPSPRTNECMFCKSEFPARKVKKIKTCDIGTSTSDIENIIATRSTVDFLGINFPIPLYVACLSKLLDDSMFIMRQVYFDELVKLDSNFPELQSAILKVVSDLKCKMLEKENGR